MDPTVYYQTRSYKTGYALGFFLAAILFLSLWYLILLRKLVPFLAIPLLALAIVAVHLFSPRFKKHGKHTITF